MRKSEERIMNHIFQDFRQTDRFKSVYDEFLAVRRKEGRLRINNNLRVKYIVEKTLRKELVF